MRRHGGDDRDPGAFYLSAPPFYHKASNPKSPMI